MSKYFLITQAQKYAKLVQAIVGLVTGMFWTGNIMT